MCGTCAFAVRCGGSSGGLGGREAGGAAGAPAPGLSPHHELLNTSRDRACSAAWWGTWAESMGGGGRGAGVPLPLAPGADGCAGVRGPSPGFLRPIGPYLFPMRCTCSPLFITVLSSQRPHQASEDSGALCLSPSHLHMAACERTAQGNPGVPMAVGGEVSRAGTQVEGEGSRMSRQPGERAAPCLPGPARDLCLPVCVRVTDGPAVSVGWRRRWAPAGESPGVDLLCSCGRTLGRLSPGYPDPPISFPYALPSLPLNPS